MMSEWEFGSLARQYLRAVLRLDESQVLGLLAAIRTDEGMRKMAAWRPETPAAMLRRAARRIGKRER